MAAAKHGILSGGGVVGRSVGVLEEWEGLQMRLQCPDGTPEREGGVDDEARGAVGLPVEAAVLAVDVLLRGAAQGKRRVISTWRRPRRQRSGGRRRLLPFPASRSRRVPARTSLAVPPYAGRIVEWPSARARFRKRRR